MRVSSRSSGADAGTDVLSELDADAIPPLVAALPSLPEPTRSEVEGALRTAYDRYVLDTNRTWQGLNLAREQARVALIGLFGAPPAPPS